MKVFISSVIRGYEAFRDAAADAITGLGYEVLRVEGRAAYEGSPRRACLEDVRRANVVILLLGERYGAKQASGLSATHEEYREAKERCSVLAFTQADTQSELDQAAFVAEVQAWAGGVLTATFRTPDDLRKLVLRALHEQALRIERGAPDEEALRARAKSLLPVASSSEPRIHLAVAAGPLQELIRPKTLTSSELSQTLQRLALFGPHPVLLATEGTKPAVEGDQLRLVQPRRAVWIAQDGATHVELPCRAGSGPESFLAVTVEDVEDAVSSSLMFVGQIYDELDPTGRITHVLPMLRMSDSGYLGWRTRVTPRNAPLSLGLGRNADMVATLIPAVRRRPSLLQQARQMAEDLTEILRRASGT